MAFYSYLSTKIIIAFITKSYQDLFGVRSYINASRKHPCESLLVYIKKRHRPILMPSWSYGLVRKTHIYLPKSENVLFTTISFASDHGYRNA